MRVREHIQESEPPQPAFLCPWRELRTCPEALLRDRAAPAASQCSAAVQRGTLSASAAALASSVSATCRCNRRSEDAEPSFSADMPSNSCRQKMSSPSPTVSEWRDNSSKLSRSEIRRSPRTASIRDSVEFLPRTAAACSTRRDNGVTSKKRSAMSFVRLGGAWNRPSAFDALRPSSIRKYGFPALVRTHHSMKSSSFDRFAGPTWPNSLRQNASLRAAKGIMRTAASLGIAVDPSSLSRRVINDQYASGLELLRQRRHHIPAPLVHPVDVLDQAGSAQLSLATAATRSTIESLMRANRYSAS